MNEIKAKVENIISSDELYQLNLTTLVGELLFVTLNVDLEIGSEINAGFRPSSVAISKSLSNDISYSNQIPVKIENIEFGEILTIVKGVINDIVLTSVITTNSAKKLALKQGENVLFLIKATDIFIV